MYFLFLWFRIKCILYYYALTTTIDLSYSFSRSRLSFALVGSMKAKNRTIIHTDTDTHSLIQVILCRRRAETKQNSYNETLKMATASKGKSSYECVVGINIRNERHTLSFDGNFTSSSSPLLLMFFFWLLSIGSAQWQLHYIMYMLKRWNTARPQPHKRAGESVCVCVCLGFCQCERTVFALPVYPFVMISIQWADHLSSDFEYVCVCAAPWAVFAVFFWNCRLRYAYCFVGGRRRTYTRAANDHCNVIKIVFDNLLVHFILGVICVVHFSVQQISRIFLFSLFDILLFLSLPFSMSLLVMLD